MRETKNIVIKEVHQTLKDGVVDHEVVYALDPSVLASVSSLTEKVQEPIKTCGNLKDPTEVVEKSVTEKNKERIFNISLIVIVVLQLSFLLGYLLIK